MAVSEEVPNRPTPHPIGGRHLTKQAEKDQTDIRKMLRRHAAQGTPLPPPGQEPRYGDFTEAQDYHTSLNRLIACQAEFELLPAAVRQACNNDPGTFLQMCSDPENREQLLELGLVEERQPPMVRVMSEPVPEPAPVVPEPS